MDMAVDRDALETALTQAGPIISFPEAKQRNPWALFAAAALNCQGKMQSTASHSHCITSMQGMFSKTHARYALEACQRAIDETLASQSQHLF